MKKTLTKGFTLIELLVVIAIIGILAAVVLASLNDARSSGSDASAKSSMNSIRNQAELHYNTNGFTYTGTCAAIDSLEAAVDERVPGAVTCNETATSYNAFVTLNDASVFCVDSSGYGGSVVVATPVTGGLCNPL